MAMTQDTVKEKEAWLVSYMANHEAALASLAKAHASLARTPSSARLSSIDARQMTIAYRLGAADASDTSDASDGEQQVSIPFSPPLKGFEEVRERVVGMVAQAGGDVSAKPARLPAPPYRFPADWYITASALLLYTWVRFSVPESYGGTIRQAVGGDKTMRSLDAVIVVGHVAESVYMAAKCVAAGSRWKDTLLWSLTTFILGFPAFKEWKVVAARQRRQAAGKKKSS